MTPPIPIRIVCTHDAMKLAEDVQRRLSAEQHAVAISCGRQSARLIETSRSLREAVILIWSLEAPSAHYMLQWAANAEPTRLIEVARTRAPKTRQHVIDFSAWEGERGGAAWRALEERLRAVTRASEPPKPQPRRAAMALAAVSAVAVGDALWLRVQDAERPPPASALADEPAPLRHMQTASFGGEGGPLTAVEPDSSSSDESVQIYRAPRVRGLEAAHFDTLKALEAPAPFAIEERRAGGVLDRLAALAAPLTHRNENER
ncbi:MAG TPA: hypothetical protein VG841_02125 [Caulobacterales bacterium]|nr:hypothetical protein [Caulobacterales bacterium]